MGKCRLLSDTGKLLLIKLFHVGVWCIFVTAIVYVCYAGVFDKVDTLAWVCIGLVFVEGIILLVNKGRCPLSVWARKYKDTHSVKFDIVPPTWVAKNNKAFFTTLFVVGLFLVFWRIV